MTHSAHHRDATPSTARTAGAGGAAQEQAQWARVFFIRGFIEWPETIVAWDWR
jgi:hypothetical protein